MQIKLLGLDSTWDLLTKLMGLLGDETKRDNTTYVYWRDTPRCMLIGSTLVQTDTYCSDQRERMPVGNRAASSPRGKPAFPPVQCARYRVSTRLRAPFWYVMPRVR